MHPQDFVAAGVDHFDSDPAVLARRERQGDRAGELRKGLIVQHTAEGLTKLLPGAPVREEGLVS